ncbi:MAG: ABC transporter permease, partial [Mycoplasmatales bacterium]|nr:ABC transporter permease [Mycoplasmatales bacterium]
MIVKKQNDIKDCGLMIIQAIHKYYYSNWLKINDLKREANFGNDGINIDNMIKLANKYGINLEAFEVKIEDIIKIAKKKIMIAIINTNG